MSLILDALNKADRERTENTEKVPTINSAHQPPPRQARSKKINVKLIAIIIVMIMTVVVSAYHLGKSKSDGSSTTAKTENTFEASLDPSTAIGAATAPTTIDTPSEAQHPSNNLADSELNKISPTPLSTMVPAITAANTEPRQVLENQRRLQQEKEKKLIEQHYQTADTEKNEKSSSNNDIENLYKKANTSSIKTPSPMPKKVKATPIESSKITSITTTITPMNDGEESSATPTPKPRNLIKNYPALNSLHDLPYVTQQQLPTINYLEHHYKKSNSYVIINGKRLNKGGNIENNLKIVEIMEDGIILEFKSKQFRHPALSSWVNF